MNIRKAKKEDAEQLKQLYFCHLTSSPPTEKQDMSAWAEMIERFEKDDKYHLLVGEIDNKIVSSVTVTIIENLTHNLRANAFIENVVTHSDYRGKHYATMLMKRAVEIAREFDCNKVILATGSKLESTLNFYEQCGFDRNEKTAFIQRL